MRGSIRRGVVGIAATAALAAVVGVSTASAEGSSPWWHLTSGSRPSYLPPEGEGEIVATVENVGDASVSGGGCEQVGEGRGSYTNAECTEPAGGAPESGDYEKTPVRVVDTLPAGVTALGAAGAIPSGNGASSIPCSVVTASLVTCELTGSLAAFGFIEVRIAVAVGHPPVVGRENTVGVSGGGAPFARITRPIVVSATPTPFGVEDYELRGEEEGGTLDTQAGSHPFQMTLAVNLDESADTNPLNYRPSVQPVELPRDLHFHWPPGLIGNATAVPSCPMGQFLQASNEENGCTPASAVGVASVSALETALGVIDETVPLFNVEAERGEPARFGFTVSGTPVLIDVSVRSGVDYGLSLKMDGITQTAALLGASVTIWGAPGEPSHESVRGYGCLLAALGKGPESACANSPEAHPKPLLSLPVSCKGAEQSDVEGDSWPQANQQEAEGVTPTLQPLASTVMPALSSCGSVPFTPELDAAPVVSDAGTSSGFNIDLHVNQEAAENAQGVATSGMRDIGLTLPSGVVLNPAGAGGLTACSEGQVGFTGFQALDPESEPEALTPTFTPELPESLDASTGSCLSSAKIGTAKLQTPILANPLVGAIYLAAQDANPFSSFLAIYVLAKDNVSGTIVKIPGALSLNPASGQITATFEGTPQIPVQDIDLEFFGGEDALLATPAHCGAYTTTASIQPWSGNPPARVSSTFDVTSGPNGGACPSSNLPFAPSIAAGTTNIDAGAFSRLTASISREDGQQAIQGFQLRLPPGLTGLLSTVKLCGEAQANDGTCGPESQIGGTVVSAGVGGNPYKLTGGRVYLTGPYAGAPFGLAIVTPVRAGPLDLESTPEHRPACDCLVIRARVEVDPQTAQLTIAAAAGTIPSVLDGIPLQIRHLSMTIDRPGFMVNPTDCAGLSIAGMVDGGEGANAPVASPFRVANCATLKFKPKVAVAVAGHASIRYGQTVNVRISYPKRATGSESWLTQAKVDIPKQLPARLKTVQQACLAGTFATDRGSCPKHSIIGHATVHTEVLPVPLEGPVYFVSYGLRKFPAVIAVLHGDGVTLELAGETVIDGRTDATTATFTSIPDMPIESVELSLPGGEYSEFGSSLPHESANFCGQKLTMSTWLEAQNGQEIHERNPIAVTGCAKPKSRPQLLASALRQCRNTDRHIKTRRASCERAARRKYATKIA